MIADVDAGIEYRAWSAGEVVHVETVPIVHAAIELITFHRVRIESFFLANDRIVRLLRSTRGSRFSGRLRSVRLGRG